MKKCTFGLDTGTRKLKCNLCGEQFANINDAVTHARTQHPNNRKEKKP